MSDRAQPVMAINPYTEKLMNIEPLFRFLKEHGPGILLIDDLIKHLVINTNQESTVFLLEHFKSPQSLFFYLYDLRDFFKELSECEISIPKTKGGNHE